MLLGFFFIIIILSRATFAANTPYNHFIFTAFFNVRLFLFLLVDTRRRDFRFLKDNWMAPTTCSVFLLSHLAEGAAGTQPWTLCSYADKYSACSAHSGNHPAMSQSQLELHIYTLIAHACDEAERNIHQTGCVREQV